MYGAMVGFWWRLFGVAGLSISLLISPCSGWYATLLEPAGPHQRSPRTILQQNPAVYTVWPNPAAIPYRVDSRYAPGDATLIRQAMDAIQSGMSQCIIYVPYNNVTHANQPSLYIGPLTTPLATPDAGQPFQTCFSFPGLRLDVVRTNGAQKVGIVNGTTGCMTQREIMKYLVNALGIRDEWKRPDRDNYIAVIATNIATLGYPSNVTGVEISRKYSDATSGTFVPGTPVTQSTAFDYNSITMPRRNKYATAGQFVYTINAVLGGAVGVTQNPVPVPTTVAGAAAVEPGQLALLSRDDCRGIQALYSLNGAQCATVTCQDPYSSGAAVPATLATVASVTLAPGVTVNPSVPTTPVTPPNPGGP